MGLRLSLGLRMRLGLRLGLLFSCEATQYPHLCVCVSVCVSSVLQSLVSAFKRLCTTMYDYMQSGFFAVPAA